ncbi:cell division protein FtsZ [Bacteroidota bacterium]|jgi:cell division protein FtsZ|nr:cell division protein FtsZ [Gammaproteobacteria bacterium]MDA9715616.1 cell division protein FtsZ [Bacteroidota bacterium]MEC7479899.1 cell division protein FtsZ [Pseudomonadota bacterium]MEC7858914.1 cell division protein FtsZ [Pseudomonadota bacterium]GIR02682.1 MAG: cell division protein FtsZ [Gammaproteobacteria bacterium]|tara:strand:+ start:18556 stop:19650 length:1095 start_codon:yes stop_codon:yes gene_type:complete
MTWQILDTNYEQAKIAIIGVGGGGGNTVQHIINSGVEGVEYICANTDAQALSMVQNAKTLKLGKDITKGLGAGNNPEAGRVATEVCREEISDLLKNTQMLFVTAGMGGGTGTGGAPVIAKIAKELGILVVGVVTTPFKTEGEKRHNQAKSGISKLMEHVDSLIEIDNEKIFEVFPPDTPIEKAFTAVNDVLVNAVRGVANIVLKPSKINVDFADVSAVMSQKGMALMGYGSASGENRSSEAIFKALNNPFFDSNEVRNAKGLLVNVCASSSITQVELKEILQEAQKVSQDGVDAIPGLTIDESFEDKLSVIIIATGLRRYDINDIQNPRIISTNNLIENVENPYVDIELINKINIQDALRRFPN